MAVELKSGDIYNTLAHGKEISLPYRDCYNFSYPELWLDESWVNAYMVIGSTLDEGAWRAEVPWEMTLAYGEKAFFHYRSHVHSWLPRLRPACDEWGVRWGWDYNIGVTFLEDES